MPLEALGAGVGTWGWKRIGLANHEWGGTIAGHERHIEKALEGKRHDGQVSGLTRLCGGPATGFSTCTVLANSNEAGTTTPTVTPGKYRAPDFVPWSEGDALGRHVWKLVNSIEGR